MKKLLILSLLALTLVACSKKAESMPHDSSRAMYFWKNTFSLTQNEQQFLKEHNIRRLYIRFFDVSVEDDYAIWDCTRVIPSATVKFQQSVPEGVEIVPTVYITADALYHINQRDNVDEIVRNLYTRIKNMCSYNDIKSWQEIQIDCDWTESTEDTFFKICGLLQEKLHSDNKLLSATIRLHQLKRAVPPVDYGVLMLYNTGNLKDPSTKNSILDPDDVRPFLKNVDYPLPLDIAYPAFKWNIMFRNGYFSHIEYSEEVVDTLLAKHYTARHEDVSVEDIEAVQHLIHEHLPQARSKHSTIIYHLDEKNLNKYTHEDIENIFND